MRALRKGRVVALSNHFELFLDRARRVRVSSDAAEVPRWVHWGPRMQLLEDWDAGGSNGVFLDGSGDAARDDPARLVSWL